MRYSQHSGPPEHEQGRPDGSGPIGGSIKFRPIIKDMEKALAADQNSTQRTETSSSADTFVSFNSSNIGVDTESAGGLFQVASLGGGSHGGGDPPEHWDGGDDEEEQVEEGDSLQGDNMPKHWHWRTAKRGGGSSGVGILGSIHENRPPPSADPIYPESPRFTTPVASDDEISVGAMSVETSGSSKLWDRMESNRHRMEATDRKLSKLMEADPLARKRTSRERRNLYVRRCAKAMVAVVALSALSASAIYLISADNLGSVTEMVPDGTAFWDFLSRVGVIDNNDSEEEENTQGHIRHRALPQSIHQEMAPAPPEDGGKILYDEPNLSPQDKNQRARAQRIRDRERRDQERRQQRRTRAAQQRIRGGNMGKAVGNNSNGSAIDESKGAPQEIER